MCDKSSGSVGRVRVELDPELVGGRQVGGDSVAAEVAKDRALSAVAVDLNVVPVAVVALLDVQLQKSEKRICLFTLSNCLSFSNRRLV